MLIDQFNTTRAELTIGTRRGYAGPDSLITPHDLVPIIARWRSGVQATAAISVHTRLTMLYGEGQDETCILVILHGQEGIRPQAESLALYLTSELDQMRIYIDLVPIRTIVIGRSDAQ